jgi:predicted naringenin-chalcone synthase
MGAFIQHISTALPESSYDQDMLRDQMKRYIGGDRRTDALLHRIYNRSGITQRYSVVDDFSSNQPSALFFNGQSSPQMPTTGERNAIYQKKAKLLFERAAQNLIDETDIDPAQVTHLITVSCTGFFAPGPGFHLLKTLSLSPKVHRFHVGFMGCFAAFPALHMANAFCQADPDAVVLIVGAELCTLHFQDSVDTDNLIAGSVFADGASAVLVSAQPLVEQRQVLEIQQLHTQITPQGEQDMAWTIGDTGFRMRLSTYVPDIIKSNLQQILSDVLDKKQDIDQIDHWAVHPGGRAILDKIEEGLKLSPTDLQHSRDILAQFGNMSSVTILFVLRQILNIPLQDPKLPESVLAMAFGPGLTIESGQLLKRLI